jgi:hypothetical protein
MDVQGIFRISGTKDEVDSLKTSFDSGLDVDFNKVKDPHAVSNILKQYLRELPDPLLTFDKYDTFIQIASKFFDFSRFYESQRFILKFYLMHSI